MQVVRNGHRHSPVYPRVCGVDVRIVLDVDPPQVYPRVCGVDSLVFNVFNAMRGLFMQIAYLFSGRIVFGFRRSGH